MKKIISLSIMFVMFFSIFTLSSISAAQSHTEGFDKKYIYDYNTLKNHYKEANNKALEYILNNNTIEGLDQFVTPGYETYIKKYKEEVSVESVDDINSNDVVELVDNLVIDGIPSTIYIYTDNSFIIESIQVTDIQNDRVLKPSTNDVSLRSLQDRKTYEYDDFNIPTRTPYLIETSYTLSLGAVKFQLNTYVDIEDANTVSVAYHNTRGSYTTPVAKDLVHEESREINQNDISHTCFTEGTYILEGSLGSTIHNYIQKAIVLENDVLLVTSYLYAE